MTYRRLFVLFCAILLPLAACGDDDGMTGPPDDGGNGGGGAALWGNSVTACEKQPNHERKHLFQNGCRCPLQAGCYAALCPASCKAGMEQYSLFSHPGWS